MMNILRKILISLAATGLLFVPALAQEAQPTQPAPQAAPNPMAGAVKAMQEAQDPSAVVDAFANAQEIDKNNVAALETYIRRMAEFGLANLVQSQLHRLLELDPTNPLGQGMQAYTHAVKGEMDKALPAILKAVQAKPVQDPFVMSVAGQLLAWYDQKPERPEFDAATHQAIEEMRRTLADKEAFADGYTRASEAYAATAAQQAQPGQPPAAGAQPAQGGTVFGEGPAVVEEGEVIVEEVPPVIYEPYPVYVPPPAVIVEPVFFDRVILVSPFFHNRHHFHHRPHHGFFFGFNFHKKFHHDKFHDGKFGHDRVGDRIRLDNGTTVAPLDLRTAVASPDLRTGVFPGATTGGRTLESRGLRVDNSGRGSGPGDRVLGTDRFRTDNSGRGSGGDRVRDDDGDRLRGGTVFGTPRGGSVIRGDNSGRGSGDRTLGTSPLPRAPLIVPRSDDSGGGRGRGGDRIDDDASGRGRGRGGDSRVISPGFRTDSSGFVRPDNSGSGSSGSRSRVLPAPPPSGRLESLRGSNSGSGSSSPPVMRQVVPFRSPSSSGSSSRVIVPRSGNSGSSSSRAVPSPSPAPSIRTIPRSNSGSGSFRSAPSLPSRSIAPSFRSSSGSGSRGSAPSFRSSSGSGSRGSAPSFRSSSGSSGRGRGGDSGGSGRGRGRGGR